MTATLDPTVPPVLPRTAPAQVGVPAAAVHGLLDALETRGLELHSLMVLRHGSVVAEGWWAPYSPDRVHLLYSLSKSFTSAAVGFAVDEGLCALDDRLVDLLPDHVPDDVDERVARLTLGQVLSMAAGHHLDALEPAWRLEPDDLARGFLRLRPDEEPGTRFAYSQPCTFVAGLVVQERSGEFLLDYLRPRLLEPLGIVPGRWDADGNGDALAFSGLHQRTEDLARFGQLLLQRGEWQGRQLLPQGWVELATRKHVDNDLDPAGNPDWSQGYGYQFWMARHGYRGDGAYGQFCVVVPEADLVVATTACVEDMQAVLDVLWEVLLPALDTVDSGEAAAVAELSDRLATLALPVVVPAVDGPGETVTFAVPRDDTATSPYGAPPLSLPTDGTAPFGPGSRMTVVPEGTDTRLDITLPDGEVLSVACGRDHWAEGLLGARAGVSRGSRGTPPRQPTPVVCRGGWTTADTFEADLVLIETPHRIRLVGKGIGRGDGDVGELMSAWNHTPLTGARIEAHLPW